MSPRTLKSRLALALAVTVTASLAIAGCSGSSDASRSDGTRSITVGIEAGSPQGAFFKEEGAAFTKQTGITVKFLAVPHSDMHQKFLTDAVSGNGAYDVFTVDEGWMPEFASKGYLSKLQLSATDRKDFQAAALETGTYKGDLYSLPYLVHNLVLYYRTDLFEKAGISSPPTTWDEYAADAKKLTDAGSGTYGTIIEGAQDAETYTHLMSLVQQQGGDIATKAGKPTFTSSEVKSALAFMRKVQVTDESSPAGLNDLTTAQGEFLGGHVGMVLMWPYLYSMAKDPAQSKVSGKFAIAMPPGNPDQVSTNFSWGFGVNASSSNQSAAKEFVDWATSTAELQKLSQAQDLPSPRQSAVAAIANDASISQSDRDALAVFSESVAASTTIPLVPEFAQYTDAMAVAISGVMSGSQSIDAATRKAQQSMKSADASSSTQ